MDLTLSTLILFHLPQQHCKNERARIVVRGVSLAAVRDRKDRVLQHSGVIGQPIQVIQFQLRQLIQRSCGVMRAENWTLGLSMRSLRTRAETLHVTLRHSLPYHLPREQISAFAHGVTNRRSVEEFDCLLRDRVGILEWNQRAPAVVQQLDRVPIRSRNDRLART